MKGSGAFVWTAVIKGLKKECGSGETASALLKQEKVGIVHEFDLGLQAIEFF